MLPKNVPRVLWIAVIYAVPLLLKAKDLSFAVPGQTGGLPMQPPSSQAREREGLSVYSRASERQLRAELPLTAEDKRLSSQLRSYTRERNWGGSRRIIDKYAGFNIVVLTAAMQAAHVCREYVYGFKIFERLHHPNITMDGPAYAVAMKLLSKLGKHAEVDELWGKLLASGLVDQVSAQARIDAAAEGGDIPQALAVLQYMEETDILPSVLHYTSAINACARADVAGKAQQASDLLDEMLGKAIDPNIVTYATLVRSWRGAAGLDMFGLIASMKSRGVRPNHIFAENFLFNYLQQGEVRKGCWTTKEAVMSDIEGLPRSHLLKAQQATGPAAFVDQPDLASIPGLR